MNKSIYNFRQFTFAREYRGYSQSELSKLIKGLSQSNLSKFEKGLGLISDEILAEIINVLNFPKSFFYKKINNLPENAHYRKRATVTKREKDNIEYSNRLIAYVIDEMSESIYWTDFKLIPLDIQEGYTPEYIARYTRKLLGLGTNDPIKNIFEILESNGVIVIEVDNVDKFDGVSLLTDRGNPIILINKNFSNDRKRFTLAHELGHLLMHICGNFPIPDFRDEKEKEKEANRFAGEFLMPKDAISSSLYNLRLSELGSLKSYWLTSMQSIIRRAYDLQSINADKYKYLNMEFSRSGRKKNEGLDVYIDRPVLFRKAYDLFKNELGYTNLELAEGFSLPIDVIEKFVGFEESRNKFRIVV